MTAKSAKQASKQDAQQAKGSGDTPSTDTPSYEAARDELIEVVRTLEQGGTSLAESLALWERGEELARICQAALDGAKARLDAALDQDPAADAEE